MFKKFLAKRKLIKEVEIDPMAYFLRVSTLMREFKGISLFIILLTSLTTLTFGQDELLTVLEGADSVKSPTSVLAVGDVAKITLSWTNAGIYDSIKIYRDISTDPTTLVYTLAGSLTSKIDTPLTGGTIYYYRIKGEIGNNLSSYSSNASDTVLFSTQAQQYFSRLPTAIAVDTLAFIAAFIDSMQGRGYWDRVDEMWLLANKTLANALVGMKGLKNATANGGYTFTVYRGWAGNGTSGYVNTNYTPSSNGVQFGLNDCGFGFYSRTDSQSDGYDIGGRDATNFTRIKSRSTSNQIDTWVNQGVGNTSRANTVSTGLIYASRTTSLFYGSYRNGTVIVGANSASSTGLLSVAMSMGGQNNQGTVANFTTREYSFGIVGDAFTAAEQVLIFGYLETLLDHLGAGVIP